MLILKAYFLEKNCKNRFSVGGSATKPPLASGGWPLRTQTLRVVTLAYYYKAFRVNV